MKMTTFQIILIAIFGAVAVAAVLIFALAIGGGSKNTVGTVVIWGTLNETAFNAVIRGEAENDVRLQHVSYVQKDEKTFITDLNSALAAGKGPDLVVIRQDEAYAEADKVIALPAGSLSTSQFQSTFIDGAMPFVGASGVFAVPFAADPLVMYWNKDMLASAGYAQPPQYWDDIYGMTQKMTVKSESGAIEKSTINFGEYQNVPAAKDILSLLIMQAGGTVTARDSSGKIVPSLAPKSGSAVQAAPSALRFYTEFADPSQSDYTWSAAQANAPQAFAAGDLALYIGYASEAPLLKRMNPNINFAVARIPQIRGASNLVDAGRVYAFAVPKTSANPTGAFTVAAILSAQALSQKLSIALGIPSARRDVLSMPAEGDDSLFNREAIILHSWVDPDPAQTDDIFRAMIEDTISGATLLTEAVQKADQQIGHILGI